MNDPKIRKATKHEIKLGIMRHPFELVICAITFLAIERVMVRLLNDPEILANSEHGLLSLPPGLLWVWCIMGILGSIFMIIGLTYSVFSARGIDIEAAGLWLSASMWLAAGLVTAYGSLSLWQLYGQYMAISAGCIIRLCVLSKIRHVVVSVPEVNR